MRPYLAAQGDSGRAIRQVGSARPRRVAAALHTRTFVRTFVALMSLETDAVEGHVAWIELEHQIVTILARHSMKAPSKSSRPKTKVRSRMSHLRVEVEDRVVTRSVDEGVGIGAAGEKIVAAAAVKRVVAVVAVERVAFRRRRPACRRRRRPRGCRCRRRRTGGRCRLSPMTVSWPSPPRTTSLPRPAATTSLPLPAFDPSLPLPASIRSPPLRAVMRSDAPEADDDVGALGAKDGFGEAGPDTECHWVGISRSPADHPYSIPMRVGRLRSRWGSPPSPVCVGRARALVLTTSLEPYRAERSAG